MWGLMPLVTQRARDLLSRSSVTFTLDTDRDLIVGVEIVGRARVRLERGVEIANGARSVDTTALALTGRLGTFTREDQSTKPVLDLQYQVEF